MRATARRIRQVSYGQSRVQVVWNRVILPDTSSFQLDNLVGTDPAGYAGLEDGVDWHWDRVFAGAALTTLLGIGAELAAPENRQDGNRVVIAGRDGLQNSVNQCRTGDDPAQHEHPADADRAAGVADAAGRESGLGIATLPAAVFQ